MRKTIGTKRAIRVFIILLIMWAVFFFTDFALVSNRHDPLFCLSAGYYAKGNKEFLGLFYKIEKTTFVDDGQKDQTTYVLSPWFFDTAQYDFSVGSIVYKK